MKLTITRTQETANCTFGVFDLDGLPLGVTLEPPWLNNQRDISCIPCGTYKGKKHSGTEFSDVWEICDVPGRDEILIHNGNFRRDTKGCPLVGRSRGIISKEITKPDGAKEVITEKGVINSRDALKDLMDRTRHETELEIEIKKNEA
jgi:hypothetical protein